MSSSEHPQPDRLRIPDTVRPSTSSEPGSQDLRTIVAGQHWALAIGGSSFAGARWISRLSNELGVDGMQALVWFPAIRQPPELGPLFDMPSESGTAIIHVFDWPNDRTLARGRLSSRTASVLERGAARMAGRRGIVPRASRDALRLAGRSFRHLAGIGSARRTWRMVKPHCAVLDEAARPAEVYYFDEEALCTAYHLARRWPTVRFGSGHERLDQP